MNRHVAENLMASVDLPEHLLGGWSQQQAPSCNAQGLHMILAALDNE